MVETRKIGTISEQKTVCRKSFEISRLSTQDIDALANGYKEKLDRLSEIGRQVDVTSLVRKYKKAIETAQEKEWVGTFAEVFFVDITDRITFEGREAYKIVTVSTYLPQGLRDKAEKVIGEVIQLEGLPAELNKNMVSFNSDHTLNAIAIPGIKLESVSKLYSAAELVVNKYHLDKKNVQVRKFREQSIAVQEKLPVLLADLEQKLNSPFEGVSAWSTRFGGAFRQEMVFVPELGKIFSADMNGKITDIMTLATTQDCKEWMSWLLAEVTKAYNEKLGNFTIYHVDSTMSVKGCAGCEAAVEFYESALEQARRTEELRKVEEQKAQQILEQLKEKEMAEQQRQKELALQQQLANEEQNKKNAQVCPDCGAVLQNGHTCASKPKKN